MKDTAHQHINGIEIESTEWHYRQRGSMSTRLNWAITISPLVFTIKKNINCGPRQTGQVEEPGGLAYFFP